jgi:transposase, IS5 family
MVRRAYTQRSPVEVLLPNGDKPWDPTLRRDDIDAILDDLIDRMAEALARRHPWSRCRGRLGTPAAVVLRLLVLKHLYDWSFDECEREVRGSLVYRAFCRIDGERGCQDADPAGPPPRRGRPQSGAHPACDPVARAAAHPGPTAARGHDRRRDQHHYPTDSTLLADGVRVLTRTLRRLGAPVRERTRSVARRVFETAQRSRTTGVRVSQRVRERTKARMKILYEGPMRITRTVVREAEAAVTQLPLRPPRRVWRLAERLHATLGVVRQALAQTRARVLPGDTHFPAKVVSVFEPYTEIIRKGKLAKPTEFGRRVLIQEAEAQFITDYQVCEHRLSDRAVWGAGLASAPGPVRPSAAARGGRVPSQADVIAAVGA